MSTETRPFPTGEMRASDADRDLAIAELSEHFQTGRLTQEEFDDRSARALQARTGRELRELFTDLPGPARPGGDAPSGQDSPAFGGSSWTGPSWTGPAWTAPSAAGPARFDRAPRCRRPAGLVFGVLAAIAVVSLLGGLAHAAVAGFGWMAAIILIAFLIRRIAHHR
jgi:Domain of unknown function (DUF1707)